MASSPKRDVAAAYGTYPDHIRDKLYQLRELILDTAAATPGVGPLTETLKWGEPAYLTEQSKSGSTIRLGWKPSAPTQYAMYFNCQTTLVDTYRTLFPELKFEGNRALIFNADETPPEAAVSKCIELALTYHLHKHLHKKQTRTRKRANR